MRNKSIETLSSLSQEIGPKIRKWVLPFLPIVIAALAYVLFVENFISSEKLLIPAIVVASISAIFALVTICPVWVISIFRSTELSISSKVILSVLPLTLAPTIYGLSSFVAIADAGSYLGHILSSKHIDSRTFHVLETKIKRETRWSEMQCRTPKIILSTGTEHRNNLCDVPAHVIKQLGQSKTITVQGSTSAYGIKVTEYESDG